MKMNADQIVKTLKWLAECTEFVFDGEALDAAADLIESLQAQLAQQQSNELLTLDELREMEGQPVLGEVGEYPREYKFFCGTHVSVGNWFPNTLGAERDWNRRTTDPNQPDLHKQTNADHIRTMSDEELATWILRLVDCGKENVLCNPTEYKLSGKCNGRCLQGRLDWLIQPAETEGME